MEHRPDHLDFAAPHHPLHDLAPVAPQHLAPRRRRAAALIALTAWVGLGVVAVVPAGAPEQPERTALTIGAVIPSLDLLPTTTLPTTTTTTTAPTTTTTAPPPPPAAKVPPPTTAPIVRTGSCQGWGDLLAAYFPPEQVDKACAVMLCESGGNPDAYNPSGASGLFQFMPGTWQSTTGQPPPASAYSPEAQIGAAAQLWQSSGWAPWMCA